MKISVAKVRVLLFEEQHSMDRAEGLAWARKVDAFGAITRLFTRPKDEEFELTYKERRYQPFWYVTANAAYDYERQGEYELPLKGGEVRSVTIAGHDYDVSGSKVTLQGVEHCSETARVEFLVDALSGAKDNSLREYLSFPHRDVSLEDLAGLSAESVLVVPPQIAATGIVREVVGGLIKRVVADEIVNEVLNIERLDLCFRPVYAFQYRWTAKERDALMEYDGLTGKFTTEGRSFKEYADQPIDPALVTGPDAQGVEELVPGGSIAVKQERPEKR
jgi:hypothetical protein